MDDDTSLFLILGGLLVGMLVVVVILYLTVGRNDRLPDAPVATTAAVGSVHAAENGSHPAQAPTSHP